MNDRIPHERLWRPGWAVAGLAAATLMFAGSGLAYAGAGDLNGAWIYIGGPAEEKARIAAVDKVTDRMNVFMKGKARGKLKERTAPPPMIRIHIEGSKLTLTGREGKALRIALGAPPMEVEGPKGKAKVSAKRVPDGFVVVSQGEKGGQRTTYQLKGDTLVAMVQMSGERLDGTLTYRMSFGRK